MPKKIKIIFIIDQLEIGGTEKQLLKMIDLINRERFEPVLICLRPSEYFSKINIPCESRILNIYSLLSISGLSGLVKFIFYLRKSKPDIVQTVFFDSTVIGIVAAKLAGVKKIISSKRDLGFWYTPRLCFVLKMLNKFVDRFLVNSKAVKRHIIEKESAPEDKIDIIYNGIDAETYINNEVKGDIRYRYNINKNETIVGIVANLNRPVKRVDLFIKAAAGILKKKANVTFLIIGDGHLTGQLISLCRDLEIEKKVFFTGIQDDIQPFISTFDVGVLCSDSEGFSNSILEYMTVGVPVVATDVGGNPEVINEGINGCLVPSGDYQTMAIKIYDLLENDVKRVQMGDNAKILIKERFSWNIKIKELEAYYIRMCA